MHNFKKGWYFVGGIALGVVVGSVGVIRFAIKNDVIRTGIAKGIAKGIADWIYNDESVTRHEQYSEVAFDVKADAEKVLVNAKAVLHTYGTVTVADIYELSGDIMSCYKDSQYGWTNLDKAKITKAKNGYYILHMPKSVKIN